MELASRQHCTDVDRNPIFSIIRNALKFNLRESKFSKNFCGGMLPDTLVRGGGSSFTLVRQILQTWTYTCVESRVTSRI